MTLIISSTGPDVVQAVNERYPGLMAKRHKNLSEFLIKEQHKVIINLEGRYSRIEDLVQTLESPVVAILKERFGVSNPLKDVADRILVDEGTAFVQFSGRSSIHGFTFEFRKPNKLAIGLAFITME